MLVCAVSINVASMLDGAVNIQANRPTCSTAQHPGALTLASLHVTLFVVLYEPVCASGGVHAQQSRLRLRYLVQRASATSGYAILHISTLLHVLIVI